MKHMSYSTGGGDRRISHPLVRRVSSTSLDHTRRRAQPSLSRVNTYAELSEHLTLRVHSHKYIGPLLALNRASARFSPSLSLYSNGDTSVGVINFTQMILDRPSTQEG